MENTKDGQTLEQNALFKNSYFTGLKTKNLGFLAWGNTPLPLALHVKNCNLTGFRGQISEFRATEHLEVQEGNAGNETAIKAVTQILSVFFSQPAADG